MSRPNEPGLWERTDSGEIEVSTPISTPKISDLLKAVNKLAHERDALAEAIHDAAVAANLVEPQSLTGPQLLLLCKDFGDLLSLKYTTPSPPEVIGPEAYSNATAVDLEKGSFDFESFKCPACEDGIIGADYFGEAIDCHCCDQRGRVSLTYFKERMDALACVAGDLQAAEYQLEELKKAPEVIEGRGQEVEHDGWYLWHVANHGMDGAIHLRSGDRFSVDTRYMRCPTFPPRATFQPPERPELILVRNRHNGVIVWRVKDTADLITCEQIDPTTGKPIEGGE